MGLNLIEAARMANRPFVVVSRSDSTLRGHFPGEVDALAKALAQDFDGWIINPFFLEGGRYTIDDIHYVNEGGWLVPAAETEFARDSAFGYRSSNLCHWVAEKTGGRFSVDEVVSVSINDLRRDGPQRVTAILAELQGGCVCVVNAASYRDLEVFIAGLLDAEAHGKRFLYRTAASFVRIRSGLSSRSLLTARDLELPDSGNGLIIVGSHVPRTTDQLHKLLAQQEISHAEVSVELLIDDKRRLMEIERVAEQVDRALDHGRDMVLFTSRQRVVGKDAETCLSIEQKISEGLIDLRMDEKAARLKKETLIRRLKKSTQAVADVSFDVHRGEIFGLLGPNGAGKTTTIRLILDIFKPEKGIVSILDGSMTEAKKDRIGYMPEDRGLYQDIPLDRCLIYLGTLKGLSRVEAHERLDGFLEHFDLADHRKKKVKELSKGMQQKAQIINTVLHHPELIIIDEPFTALDPINTQLVKDLMQELRDQGTTIIMSTHQMHQVEELCDRIVLIDEGRDVLYGNLEEIRRRYSGNAVLVRSAGELPSVAGAEVVSQHNGTFKLTLAEGTSPQDVLSELIAQNVLLEKFEIAIPSVSEIFIRVVEEGDK